MTAKKHYIIGVDTGGTFTDVVVLGGSGEVCTAKASTTPDDFSRGVMDAVQEAAGALGVDTSELLGQTSLFKHGSTVAGIKMLVGAALGKTLDDSIEGELAF